MKAELEDMRSKESVMLFMREKERRAAEVLSRQVRHLTEVRQADADLVAKAEQVLSSTPTLLSHYATYGWESESPDSGTTCGYTRRSSGSILGNANYHRRLTRALSGAETGGVEERRSSLAGPVQVPVMRVKGFRNLSAVNEATPLSTPDSNAPPPPLVERPFFPRSPPKRPSLSKSAPTAEIPCKETLVTQTGEPSLIVNEPASNSEVLSVPLNAVHSPSSKPNERSDSVDSSDDDAYHPETQSIELRYKKRIFELEVMLQEAQREKQREQDIFIEKEKDYKRKLSKYESNSKPNGEVNDSAEAGGRASLIAMLNKRQPPSSPTKKPSEASSGILSPTEARGNLMAMLNQRGASGGTLARASSSKNVSSTTPAVLGIKPAVKSDNTPPIPPPLPIDAVKVLSNQPGGIPLAPPLPGTVEVVRMREAPAKPKKPVVEPRYDVLSYRLSHIGCLCVPYFGVKFLIERSVLLYGKIFQTVR